MKERKPIMKKESKTKYIVFIVLIVLALGILAYDKFDINLKDIKLFEKDKSINEEGRDASSNISIDDTLNRLSSSMGGLTMFVVAMSLFGVVIVIFIFPLFRRMGGEV